MMFYLSPESTPPPSYINQCYVLQSNVLLEQIFFKDGPIDWSLSLGLNFRNIEKHNLKKHFASVGINLDAIKVAVK